MAQSIPRLYVHIIFHTKLSENTIRQNIENKLYSYIGKIIQENDSHPIKINGTVIGKYIRMLFI